jgi:hypothetical protein
MMVDFDGTYFVAVGRDNRYGIGSDTQRNNIIYSYDGLTWYYVSSFKGTGDHKWGDFATAYGVAHGNGNWVACGRSSGTASTHASIYYTSNTDMANWKPANPFLAPNGRGYSVAYGAGIWVVVGETLGSDNNIFWANETDLTTWTGVSAFGVGGRGNQVVYDPVGGWIAVGSGSSNCYMSNDGKTWTGTNRQNGGEINSAAYGNGAWVITGTNGLGTGNNTSISSGSGPSRTWSTLAQFGNTGNGNYVYYKNNYFMVGGHDTSGNNYNLYYLADGGTWTGVSVFGTGKVTSIYYYGGYWLAGGNDPVTNVSLKFALDNDKNRWVAATDVFDVASTQPYVNSIVYGNGVWCVSGNINTSGHPELAGIASTRQIQAPIPGLNERVTLISNGNSPSTLTWNIANGVPSTTYTYVINGGNYVTGSGTTTGSGTLSDSGVNSFTTTDTFKAGNVSITVTFSNSRTATAYATILGFELATLVSNGNSPSTLTCDITNGTPSATYTYVITGKNHVTGLTTTTGTGRLSASGLDNFTTANTFETGAVSITLTFSDSNVVTANATILPFELATLVSNGNSPSTLTCNITNGTPSATYTYVIAGKNHVTGLTTTSGSGTLTSFGVDNFTTTDTFEAGAVRITLTFSDSNVVIANATIASIAIVGLVANSKSPSTLTCNIANGTPSATYTYVIIGKNHVTGLTTTTGTGTLTSFGVKSFTTTDTFETGAVRMTLTFSDSSVVTANVTIADSPPECPVIIGKFFAPDSSQSIADRRRRIIKKCNTGNGKSICAAQQYSSAKR